MIKLMIIDKLRSGGKNIRTEVIGPHFTKYFMDGRIFHHFTAPDFGDPHDHSSSFTSFVIFGGYVEEVYDYGYPPRIQIRKPGERFYVPFHRVHRIIELPEKECWIEAEPGEWRRKPGFYQFREDGAYHRFWDESEWTPIDWVQKGWIGEEVTARR
jgi:hypothetical protein